MAGSLFVKSDATISPCGKYRYRLSRVWDESLALVWWIMLNPSTANHVRDDPTIRRVTSFTSAWGYGGFVVVNLFALRSPYPKALLTHPDPVGPENDSHLFAANNAPLVMAAWGASVPLGRDKKVVELLAGKQLHCLELSKGGMPRHPLFVRGDAKPILFGG